MARLAKKPALHRPIRASGGAVAQLGERRNRTAEVRGSNPLGSTNDFNNLKPRWIWRRVVPEAYRKQPHRTRSRSKIDPLRLADAHFDMSDFGTLPQPRLPSLDRTFAAALYRALRVRRRAIVLTIGKRRDCFRVTLGALRIPPREVEERVCLRSPMPGQQYRQQRCRSRRGRTSSPAGLRIDHADERGARRCAWQALPSVQPSAPMRRQSVDCANAWAAA
jgi:hypothetical protein